MISSLLVAIIAVSLSAIVAFRTLNKPAMNKTFICFGLITPLIVIVGLFLWRGWTAIHVFSALVLWYLIQLMPLTQPEIITIAAWLYLETLYAMTYYIIRKVIQHFFLQTTKLKREPDKPPQSQTENRSQPKKNRT